MKALNLKILPKHLFVGSFHFVDNKPTQEYPNQEKWLGYEALLKKNKKNKEKKNMLGATESVRYIKLFVYIGLL